MKVFISWSGERSRHVAEFLRQWLHDVIQAAQPWMSGADINAGARWSAEIQGELAETRFGIVCLTRDNLHEPWILFETGALAKTVDDTFVCPYLLDLKPSELPAGPLAQFQAKEATKEGTWDLVKAVNNALKDHGEPEAVVRRRFDKWWEELAEKIKTLPGLKTPAPPKRSSEDIVTEVLVLARQIATQGEEARERDRVILERLPREPRRAGTWAFGDEIEAAYARMLRDVRRKAIARSRAEGLLGTRDRPVEEKEPESGAGEAPQS